MDMYIACQWILTITTRINPFIIGGYTFTKTLIAMTILIIGLLLFFAVHLVPVFASLRQSLVASWGEPIYKTVFAIVSAIGFVVLLMGKSRAGFIPVWNPPLWGVTAAKVLMAPTFILLVSAYFPSNIKRVVGHPMLVAIFLWSVAHLLSNGDQASVLLFGSFALYAVVDWCAEIKRNPKSATKKVPMKNDIIVIVVGILLLLFVYRIHSAVFAPI